MNSEGGTCILQGTGLPGLKSRGHQRAAQDIISLYPSSGVILLFSRRANREEIQRRRREGEKRSVRGFISLVWYNNDPLAVHDVDIANRRKMGDQINEEEGGRALSSSLQPKSPAFPVQPKKRRAGTRRCSFRRRLSLTEPGRCASRSKASPPPQQPLQSKAIDTRKAKGADNEGTLSFTRTLDSFGSDHVMRFIGTAMRHARPINHIPHRTPNTGFDALSPATFTGVASLAAAIR